MRLPQDASSFRVNWSIFCLCEAQQLTTRNGPVWTQLEVLTVFLSLTKEICISIVTNPLKIINHLQSMTITSDQSVLRCSNQNSKIFHFISATNLMVKWVVDRTPTSHDLLEATKDINYLKSSPTSAKALKVMNDSKAFLYNCNIHQILDISLNNWRKVPLVHDLGQSVAFTRAICACRYWEGVRFKQKINKSLFLFFVVPLKQFIHNKM